MVSIISFIKHNDNKMMTVQAWAYAAWYRFLIRFRSRKHLEKHWGVLGEETGQTLTLEQYKYARLVSRQVNRIANHTPWESKCLVRALAARRFLCKKKISNTLYLGVGKDETGKMVAHAWIRAGSAYVTGGDGSEYATVAMFKNEFKDESQSD